MVWRNRWSLKAWRAARACGFALMVLATTAPQTWAADRTIILKGAAASPLLLERPFNIMLIGDPDVVDVLTRDDRSVVLQPLKAGATNVIFLDEKSIVITNVGILVCEIGASAIMYLDGSSCEHADDRPI